MKIFKKILYYTLPLICFFSMCSTAIAENTDDDDEFEIVVIKTGDGPSDGPDSLYYRYLKVLQNTSLSNTSIDAMTVGIRLVTSSIDTSYQISIGDTEDFFSSGCFLSPEGDLYRYNYVEFDSLFSIENTPGCYFLEYTLEIETSDGSIERDIALMGKGVLTSRRPPEMPPVCLPETLSGCRYQDSLALVTLYNSTDGDNWTNTWDLNDSIDTWHGVTLNSSGCVKHLKLHSNQLDGTIPPELGNLDSLTLLWLYNNQLTDSIPSELGDLINLVKLRLYGNQLSGSIPPELGNLTELKQLKLYSNQLSGSIPPELGNLTKLTHLWLYNNDLTGNIPGELGNLINLKQLWLENNQLSGGIPYTLGNLNQVIQLRLNDNQLMGPIPKELGNMSNMVGLWLKNNQLWGCYKQNLANLCGQLSVTYSSNSYISDGNSFYDTWEDFCDTEITNCTADRLVPSSDLPEMSMQPNPLNSMTTIEFTLSEDTNVNLNVLNPKGQVINQLIQNQQMIEGTHQFNFEATQLPTGVYYCVLTAGNARQIQKMLIVK